MEFIKSKLVSLKTEEKLIQQKLNYGIKVKSVCLPKKFTNTNKSEEEILSWLQTIIFNIYSAYYQHRNKYKI